MKDLDYFSEKLGKQWTYDPSEVSDSYDEARFVVETKFKYNDIYTVELLSDKASVFNQFIWLWIRSDNRIYNLYLRMEGIRGHQPEELKMHHDNLRAAMANEAICKEKMVEWLSDMDTRTRNAQTKKED